MQDRIKTTLLHVFTKPYAALITAALLFLPLFFLGTHTSHDWGDDFAQYIHQTINIVNGIPQSETGYIYNQLNCIGPKAYPIGFPLMLVPVYAIAGNSMLAFTSYISFFYIVLALLLVIFYRNYFSWISAIALTLIFTYNPQMLLFKSEIMSDIPFMALLALNFILYQRLKNGNLKQLIVIAISAGAMLALRPVGIVFIAAVSLEQLLLFIRRKIDLQGFAMKTVALTLIPIGIYVLLNMIIYKIPSGGSINDYLLLFYSGNIFQVIPENFAHHVEVFRYLYVPFTDSFRGFALLLGSAMLTLSLIGFLIRLARNPQAIDWFFIMYACMLLVYPNNSSAFRLMMPIGFIILLYVGTGLKSIRFLTTMPEWGKAVLLGGIVLLLFIPGITKVVRAGNKTLDGPQQKTSIEAFKYIRENVTHEAIIVFVKPRALALYAGCNGMADPFTTDPTLIHLQIMEAKASHLLIHNTITAESLKRYSRVMSNRLTKEWGNKDFILYKINPIDPSIHQ